MLIKANTGFGQTGHGVNSDFESRCGKGLRVRMLFVILSILLLWATGVFFCAYQLLPEGKGRTEVYRPVAEQHLISVLRGRARAGLLEGEGRTLAPEDLETRVQQLTREAIDSDPRGFKSAVNQLHLEMPRKVSGERSKRHYLLEADPYYYFGLTKRIADTGGLGFRLSKGKYYDPLRQYPHWVWMPPALHPHAGYLFYRLLNFIKQLPLMEALCYFPLAVLGLVVLAYYNLVRTMKLGVTAFVLSGLVLAPIFLQRSSFEWYDTEPYHIVFPCLILTCITASLQPAKKSAVREDLLAGTLTALYACFWMGWPLFFCLAAGIALLYSFIPVNSGDCNRPRRMRQFFWLMCFRPLQLL